MGFLQSVGPAHRPAEVDPAPRLAAVPAPRARVSTGRCVNSLAAVSRASTGLNFVLNTRRDQAVDTIAVGRSGTVSLTNPCNAETLSGTGPVNRNRPGGIR